MRCAPDLAHQRLEVRHGGQAEAFEQGQIPVQFRAAAHHAIPAHDGAGVGNHPGLQCHQRTEDLERGGRNETLLRQSGITGEVLAGCLVQHQHSAREAGGTHVPGDALQHGDGRLRLGAGNEQPKAGKQGQAELHKRLHGAFS